MRLRQKTSSIIQDTIEEAKLTASQELKEDCDTNNTKN